MTVQLPSVDWLFIHTAIITRPAPADVVDSEGRIVTGTAGPPVSVSGYLALTNRAEIELADALGVRVDAVFACARDTDVDEQCTLTATGVDPHLDGSYSITAARPTPVHLRLLLQRTVGHEPR